MSLFTYIQRSNCIARVCQKTFTNYVENSLVKVSCRNVTRMLCSTVEPKTLLENKLIKDVFSNDLFTTNDSQDQEENKFGNLSKSLESVRRKEKESDAAKNLAQGENCAISDVNESLKTATKRGRSGTLKKSKIVTKIETDDAQINVSISKRNLFHKKFSEDKNNFSNTFGNLSDSNSMWYPDVTEEPRVVNDPNDDSVIVLPGDGKLRTGKTYLSEMKRLVKEKKIKEALELFLDMKRNYVQPIHANYTFMIGACGRAGYTEMAFKLLRQMTDKGFQPTPATLTGAFNSCAQCPFPEYGLKKAHTLKSKIEQKNWLVTQPTYHSMIKAFGKCGDILTAFQIVDEMAEADIKIDDSTYSFLLMSCAADKEAGFTHAVEVWRKMKAKKIKPNLFTYNLLLRTVRDCGIGPEEISCLLLQHWSSFSKRPYGLGIKQISSKQDFLKLTRSVDNVDSNIEDAAADHTKELFSETKSEATGTSQNVGKPEHSVESFVEKESSIMKHMNVPSLLAARPFSQIEDVNLTSIVKPGDRLALLGGTAGFVEHMKNNKINPDIKTFTLLLESLPYHTNAEEELLLLLDTYNVKPDIDFFNILIKRRNLRKDVNSGRGTLMLIRKYALSPDIVTFGVLAMGCLNRKQAALLLSDMNKLNICPNIQIIGALIHNATKAVDFQYMQDILELMIEKEIKPNEKLLMLLEGTVQLARKNIIDLEQDKDVDAVFKSDSFKKHYKIFCSYYEDWLKNSGLEITQHPWLQYKTEITEKIKDADDM